MYPELLHIGPFTLHSFWLMMALAFVSAGLVTAWQFRRRGVDPAFTYTLVLAAIIGGVVGAKIHYLLVHPGEFPQNALSGSGLIWYGGLAGGTAAVWLATWRSPWRYGVVADCIAPALAMAYAVGRIGCLLRGDDYGVPTDLPWAMRFPEGAPPTDALVHPTQIYEILGSLGIFGLLVWVLAPRLTRSGALFWAYLVLAGIERFLVEFVRTNTAVVLGLTQAQVISIGMMLAGAAGLVWIYSRPASEQAGPLRSRAVAAGGTGGRRAVPSTGPTKTQGRASAGGSRRRGPSGVHHRRR